MNPRIIDKELCSRYLRLGESDEAKSVARDIEDGVITSCEHWLQEQRPCGDRRGRTRHPVDAPLKSRLSLFLLILTRNNRNQIHEVTEITRREARAENANPRTSSQPSLPMRYQLLRTGRLIDDFRSHVLGQDRQ